MMLEELLDRPGREVIVLTFLAILELWREQAITVVQDVCFGSISILPKARVSETFSSEAVA